ncbi:MAG: hypothetical protein KF726_06045 [Anaerolineae bacterium]|nr:hypothetical protein [Anaerolineae bacterium]
MRPTVVRRTRLLDALATAFEARLTIVTAPAGFGKTTLLSEWATAKADHVAWYTLDPSDDQLTRFLCCVVVALQTIEPQLGVESLKLVESNALSSSPEAFSQSFLTPLINDLVQWGDEVALVLDDYHEIALPAIHEAVAYLLRHAPPTLHLLVASRHDPPLPLARLRARGELFELTADDIRFTPSEITAFFAQIGFGELSGATVEALAQRTEGWIAGLQLVALSTRDRDALPRVVTALAGTNRYIAEYLLDEVFKLQTADIRRFLLHTAILSQLNAGLCNAVTGESGSQVVLEQLEAMNLFTTPLDHQRRWYRYHQLFADFLMDRLRKTEPQRIPELHKRAADWYQQQGLLAEAIDQFLKADAYEEAADIIEQYVGVTQISGIDVSALRWLDALPQTLVESRPTLCLLYAGLLIMAGRTDNVDRLNVLLAAAHRGMIDEHLELGAALPAIMALLRGNSSEELDYAQQQLSALVEQVPLLRGALTLSLGEVYRLTGDLGMAESLLEEAGTLYQTGGEARTALIATCQRGYVQLFAGDLQKANATFRSGLRQSESLPPAERPLATVTLLHTGLGQIFLSWNDITAADFHAREARRIAERIGEKRVAIMAHILHTQVLTAQAQYQSAIEVLEDAEKIAITHQLDEESQAYVSAWRAHVWLASGENARAAAWLQQLTLDDETILHPGYRETLITVVRVMTTRRQFQAAIDLLNRGLETWDKGRMSRGGIIEALILGAGLRIALNEMDKALINLEKALSLAEPGGYIREFVNAGTLILPLLRHYVGHVPNAPFARQVLGSFEEKLSEREIELLGLIAEGLPNHEIAAKLVVTPETVKWHIKNIYRKLGVASRTEAIREAKVRRLL